MIKVVAGLFMGEVKGTWLIGKRKSGTYDGCWEFPGGKMKPGEDHAQALNRELKEELGCDVCVYSWRGSFESATDVFFELLLYRVDLAYGSPEPQCLNDHYEIRYATLADIALIPESECTPSLQPLVRQLMERSYV